VRSEDALVRALEATLGGAVAGVAVGIGDDCAVLDRPPGPLVWTVDAHVDEVHFRRKWLGYEDVGYRSFAAAASDVVAMGAAPLAALSALTLDAAVGEADVIALARGQRAAAAEGATGVVGGNVSRGGTFSVTTTVLGRALGSGAVLRSGASAGDLVLVGGALGLATLGLSALEAGREEDPALAACVAAFRRPRVAYALAGAVARARAAIDISDGLALDLHRVAHASRVRVVLDEGALVAAGGAALREGARELGRDPLACALEGGEDYVVVVSWAPDAELPAGFSPIGRVEEGLGLALNDGRAVRELPPRGHDHLAGGGAPPSRSM